MALVKHLKCICILLICLLVYKFISDIKEIIHSAGQDGNKATPKTETSPKTESSDSKSDQSDSDERIKRLPQVICIGAKKCGTGFGSFGIFSLFASVAKGLAIVRSLTKSKNHPS